MESGAGVILDEAHFIKNNSQRTSHCLKLLGVSNIAREPVIGPRQVYCSPVHPLPTGHETCSISCAALATLEQGVPLLRKTVQRRLQEPLRLGHKRGVEPRGAKPSHEGGDAPSKEGRGPRSAAENPHLGSARGRECGRLNAQRSFAQWFAASDASRPNAKIPCQPHQGPGRDFRRPSKRPWKSEFAT